MLLHWILLGAGVILKDLLYIFCPDLSWWWQWPLALAGYVAATVVYIFILFIISLFPAGAHRYYGDPCHGTVKLTIPWIISLLGIRTEVRGADTLPDEPFLLVSNHRSNWDPLVTVAAFKERKISFVSKPENFKLPIAGGWMRRAAFIPIDRENPRKAMTAIHQAADLISEHGLSVGLYPEGTRNKAQALLPLLPFHNGSLKIAKLAKCPLVVMTVRYEKAFLWVKTAHLSVVSVIDADTVTASRPDALGDMVKNAIEQELEND